MKVGAVATPLALVFTVAAVPVPGAANAPVAPPLGAVKVTDTPEMPLPLPSFTVTCKAANAVFTAALCEAGVPGTITVAGPGKFVRLKLNVVADPDDAFTVNGPPATLFAVKVGAVATPLALVVAVAVAPPANTPLAPPVAAVTVKVTVAPVTRFPPLSFTVTCMGANAVLMLALSEAALAAVIAAGGPTRFVRLKLAEKAPAEATTL